MARRSSVYGLTLLASAAIAAPAASETWFVLENGRTILGDVIQATRNTLMVRRDDGGLQPLARSQVERVEIETVDGERLTGTLGDWRDGRLGLDVGAERVWIAEARIVGRERVQAVPAPEPEPAQARDMAPAQTPEADIRRERVPAPQVAEPEPAPTREMAPAQMRGADIPPAQDAGLARAPQAAMVPQAETAAPAEPDPAQAPAAESAQAALAFRSALAAPNREDEEQALNRPPMEAPAAGPQQEAGADQDPKLAALQPAGTALPMLSAQPVAGEVLEKLGEVAFKVELSRASDRPVAVIYSTVDGDAAGGTDYEPQQGILTLKPGETSATLRVALIDDDEPEGDKKFHLFISTKAGQADVTDKWVPVVIKDDDGPAW